MKKLFSRLMLTICACVMMLFSTSVLASQDENSGVGFSSNVESAAISSSSNITDISSTDWANFSKYMYDSWIDFKRDIDVSAYRISTDEIATLYYESLYEYPELFYVKSQLEWSYRNGYVTSVRPVYTFPQNGIKSYIDAYNKEVEKVVSGMPSKFTDLEKALYINDYLDRTCKYGNPDDVYAHCAYGAMVNKTPVCQGYALAFADIAKRVGLTCYMVDSTQLKHAWNMVKINGQYYYIDTTYNDPTSDRVGRACHDYFLLSEKTLKSKHHNSSDWIVRKAGVKSNNATSTKYENYVWNNAISSFYYVDGYWYGMDGKGIFGKYSCDGKDFKLVKTIDTMTEYCNATAMWNGIIYYSDYYEIRYYIPSNGTKGSVLKTSMGIVGINIDGNGNTRMQTADESIYNFDQYKIKGVTDISSSKMKFIKNDKVLSESKSIAFDYDGKKKTTKVNIVVDGVTLKEGVDYKLSYKNNIKCGTATITATGMGNYSGKLTRKFTISAKGKCGTKAKWAFDSKTGKLTISGTGAMTNYKNVNKTPWYQFGSKIKTIVIGKGITVIGKNAFREFTGLKSVEVGTRVTTIGKNAFYGSKKLSKITIKSKKVNVFGKGAFAKIYAKSKIYVPSAKIKAYKKAIKNSGIATTVTIKKIA